MASRWLRLLGALGAGGAVMFTLFLLTLFAEDRPLWGVDAGILSLAAAVLAILAGFSVSGWLASWSTRAMVQGGVLGGAGFGIVFLASMAIVVGFPGHGASYEGWQASTNFDDPWNATRAREALEAQGFNISTQHPDRLVATADPDVTAILYVHDQRDPGNASDAQPTFLLSVGFRADGGWVDRYEEAQEQADADRPTFEDRFHEILEAFGTATGWTHMDPVHWEARISVA